MWPKIKVVNEFLLWRWRSRSQLLSRASLRGCSSLVAFPIFASFPGRRGKMPGSPELGGGSSHGEQEQIKWFSIVETRGPPASLELGRCLQTGRIYLPDIAYWADTEHLLCVWDSQANLGNEYFPWDVRMLEYQPVCPGNGYNSVYGRRIGGKDKREVFYLMGKLRCYHSLDSGLFIGNVVSGMGYGWGLAWSKGSPWYRARQVWTQATEL